MKSPDQAAFKTILIITMIIAVAMLPFVAKADSHKMHRPPPFSDFDENGDGVVSAEEFADIASRAYGCYGRIRQADERRCLGARIQ